MPSLQREELRDSLVDLLEPVVESSGAQLVDLELMGPVNNQTLRLLVHKEVGITIRDCETISVEVADFLDVEDPIPGRYRLEVTSPGVDRPLETDGDFARSRGRLLKVVLHSGKTLSGRLQAWDGERIELEFLGGIEQIDRCEIVKATIEVEM